MRSLLIAALGVTGALASSGCCPVVNGDDYCACGPCSGDSSTSTSISTYVPKTPYVASGVNAPKSSVNGNLDGHTKAATVVEHKTHTWTMIKPSDVMASLQKIASATPSAISFLNNAKPSGGQLDDDIEVPADCTFLPQDGSYPSSSAADSSQPEQTATFTGREHDDQGSSTTETDETYASRTNTGPSSTSTSTSTSTSSSTDKDSSSTDKSSASDKDASSTGSDSSSTTTTTGKDSSSTTLSTSTKSTGSSSSTTNTGTGTKPFPTSSNSTTTAGPTGTGSSSTSTGTKTPTQQTKCSSPTARVEWRNMQTSDQQSLMRAVRCLMTTSPRSNLPGTKSRWDDLVAIHQTMGPKIHEVGAFLVWHRQFMWVYEQELRNTCKYTGPIPWWDETKDAGHFANAPMMSKDFYGTAKVGDDTCVTDGSFSNATFHVGPGNSNVDHCLSRGVNEDDSSQVTQSFVNSCNSYTGYGDMNLCSYYGPHAYAHTAVGGSMSDVLSSPNDPMFFVHHAFIDRNYRNWQLVDAKNRTYAIGGYTTKECTKGGANCKKTGINDVLSTMGFYPDVTIGQVADTQGGHLCYYYDS